jgi:PPOX class probable F420-dependent enzyme
MARLAARTTSKTGLIVAEAPSIGALDQIRRSKHSLLVTYRRDGTPVPTPAWVAEHEGVLYARVERGSGKLKRMRRDRRVLVAPCTFRGTLRGAALEAVGRVLAPEEEPRAERALAARYGLGRWLFERSADLLRTDMCYLELTPGAWEDEMDSKTRA